MIRAAAALLLASAALTPLQALAQMPPAPASVDPARYALGYELAKVLNPEAPTMAALDNAFVTQLPQAMMAAPGMKELEAQYPGIVKAMVEAMKPILIRYLRAELPGLWGRIGTLFASEMTEAELRASLDFYRSPTGTRLIALMLTEADIGPMIDQMAANDFTLSAGTVGSSLNTTARKALEQLTPAQLEDVTRFARSPAGRKIALVTPRMHKLIADWSNEPAPEIEAEIEAALKPVVERFTGTKL